jgi:hypothetical protein
LLRYLQARCSWNDVRAGTKGKASGVYLGDVELENKFCGYSDYIEWSSLPYLWLPLLYFVVALTTFCSHPDYNTWLCWLYFVAVLTTVFGFPDYILCLAWLYFVVVLTVFCVSFSPYRHIPLNTTTRQLQFPSVSARFIQGMSVSSHYRRRLQANGQGLGFS